MSDAVLFTPGPHRGSAAPGRVFARIGSPHASDMDMMTGSPSSDEDDDLQARCRPPQSPAHVLAPPCLWRLRSDLLQAETYSTPAARMQNGSMRGGSIFSLSDTEDLKMRQRASLILGDAAKSRARLDAI